jgi:mitochondrial fission protein ELM1
VNARRVERAPRKNADPTAPVVWILLGHRTGDNLQLQALADGLGWPWQAKTLTWPNRPARWTPFYGRTASLKHLEPKARGDFGSPWPDLVLSIGWRSVPVARWIQKMAGARLVHLGRPRAPLDYFDVILTTPQYRMPQAGNVVELEGPLTTVAPENLLASADAWAPRFAHLPRPWFAVLIGGDTPTLRFPTSAAKDLASACDRLAASCQGSLLVATSPRTSQDVTDTFLSALTTPSFCFRWRATADNPYPAFLALADQFIVTNDSVSMTHEAALTGRPLHIFPLHRNESWYRTALRRLDHRLRTKHQMIAKAYESLIRSGLIYPPKSTADYFERLIRSGSAVRLGSPATGIDFRPCTSENERAIQAVKSLFLPAEDSGPGEAE